MSKDPAFLFYSKDWLEGTAEMTPEEKGVYIDLLAHQHQKGGLPQETKRLSKLVGLGETEFIPIWADLCTKFTPNGVGRLVNQKLNGIVTERMDKAHRNRIIGTLAAVVKNSSVSPEIKIEAKKTFKVTDFLPYGSEVLTEKVTEWYCKRLKSIVNVNSIYNNGISIDTSINTDIINNTNTEIKIEKKQKNFPNQESLGMELPEIKRGSVIELFKITKQSEVSIQEIEGLWSIFKNQNFTGENYYKSESAIYSHFINWCKTQNISKNGNAANFNGNGKHQTARERQTAASEAVLGDLAATAKLIEARRNGIST